LYENIVLDVELVVNIYDIYFDILIRYMLTVTLVKLFFILRIVLRYLSCLLLF